MPTSSQLKIMSTWNYKKKLIVVSSTYHFLLLYILVHFYTTRSSDVTPHLCNANIAYLLSDEKSVLCCLVYTCIKVFIARCTWLHVPLLEPLPVGGGDWCTLTRKFTCPCLVPARSFVCRCDRYQCWQFVSLLSSIRTRKVFAIV